MKNIFRLSLFCMAVGVHLTAVTLPNKPNRNTPVKVTRPTNPINKVQAAQKVNAQKITRVAPKPITNNLRKDVGAKFKHHSHSSSHHSKCHKCKEIVTINEHDINKASAAGIDGYVIDKPGTYKLCEDVRWVARANSSFAITISSDNVTLDFDGHFITQVDTTKAGNFAVQVGPTAENTIIHNGVIDQCSGGGILVQTGADSVTVNKMEFNHCSYNGATPITGIVGGLSSWAAAILVNPNGFQNIIPGTSYTTEPVDNMIITNCVFRDTGILGTPPVSFVGEITNNTLTLLDEPLYPLTPGFVLSGDSIVGTPTILSGSGTTYTISGPAQPSIAFEPMTVTDPNGTFIPFGEISAIFLNPTTNAFIDNILLDNTFGYLLSWGVTIEGSKSFTLSNATIKNTVSFGLTKGVLIGFCTDYLIEDMDISGVTCNVLPLPIPFPSISAEAIKISAGTNDYIIRRVTATGIAVQTEVPTELAPFAYMNATGLMIDQLASVLVVVPSPDSSNAVIEDYTVVGVSNDGGMTPGTRAFATGYNGDALNNIEYTRCSASDIRGTDGCSWAYGFGFFPTIGFTSNGSPDLIYRECTAENVSISDSGLFAAGFVLSGARNQVTNCIANKIQDLRGSPLTGTAAYGILLNESQVCLDPSPCVPFEQALNCLVANNVLTNCDTCAVFDSTTATPKTGIVTGNYAAFNGLNGVASNYVGLNPNTPIAVWQPYQTAPAPATPSILDNIDIQK